MISHDFIPILSGKNSSLEIMNVLKKYYIENTTDCVNYTIFYTRVYTTV